MNEETRKLRRWIDADSLLKRWQLSPEELADWICNFGLPSYSRFEGTFMNVENPSQLLEEYNVAPPFALIRQMVLNDNLGFALDDVEAFEKDHPELKSKEPTRESEPTLG